MKPAKRPAFQFYPKEWIWDLDLRQCSIAARGLWADLLCMMHEAKPYGTLTYPVNLVLQVTGLTPTDFDGLISDLEKHQVFSRMGDGTIYSRRMVRDEERRNSAVINGGKGGNPQLVKGEVNPGKQDPRISDPEEKRRVFNTEEEAKNWDAETAFRQLWDAYPAKGRTDFTLSQQYFCEEVTAANFPTVLESVTTGKWAKSEKWAKGFVKALPAWIHNRAWETEGPEPAEQTTTVEDTMDPETARRLRRG